MYSTVLLVKVSTCTLLAVLSVIANYRARNKVASCVDEMKEYRFKLRLLAGVGFYITKYLGCRPNSDYDRKVRARLHHLYGHSRIDCFYQIHLAQKATLLSALGLILAAVALLGTVDPSFYIFGLIMAGLIYYQADREIDKRLKQKKQDILIDLPEFTNTLALLVNAGLPFTAAVNKIVKQSSPERPLFREIRVLLAELESGRHLGQAYEEFAQRCKVPEVTRFVSVVLQNLNRGSSDLVYVLRNFAQEAWQKRKDIARKQGEEAGAKLILPMAMVFISVSIIVLAPAVMTMGR